MLWISVGIGIVISLVFAEWFGLSAGGIVVPGYIALYWHKPIQILGTLFAALLAWGVLKIISSYAFIYGRRRLVATILLGFLSGSLLRYLSALVGLETELYFGPIGYVIPGLIAYWIEKQGFIETLCAMTIASAITRFAVILIFGGAQIDVLAY